MRYGSSRAFECERPASSRPGIAHFPDCAARLVSRLQREQDDAVREVILGALVRMNDPIALSGLVDCLRSEDAALRNEVIERSPRWVAKLTHAAIFVQRSRSGFAHLRGQYSCVLAASRCGELADRGHRARYSPQCLRRCGGSSLRSRHGSGHRCACPPQGTLRL